MHALVTGVSRSRGIAAAVARALAGEGWSLTLTGSPSPEVGGVLAGLPAGRAHWVTDDLADPGAPARLFDAALGHAGPVTALLNVAAHSARDGVLDATVHEFDRHIAVNARGTLLMTQEFARRFAGPWGRVINFVSGPPLRGEVSYAASKGAIEWITYSSAAELAGRRITVNAIDPGPNDTGWMTDEERAYLDARHPMGRVGTPEDVAPLVAFLCSERAGWMTGQLLRCDGGWHALRRD